MRALLLIALLGLTACDSTAPTPVPLRSFEVTNVPSIPSIEMRDTVRVAAPQFAGPTAPTLTVIASPGVETTLEGDSLSLRALALGDATVSIRASAAGYRDTTVVLAMTVVPGVCPPGPQAGQYDLFPFDDGQEWTFSDSRVSGSTINWTDFPSVVARFEDVQCLRGERSGRVRYRGGVSERVEVRETADNVISFATPQRAASGRRVTFVRYQSSPSLTLSNGTCIDGRMEFIADVGLQRDTFLCYGGGGGGYSGRRFVRQP